MLFCFLGKGRLWVFQFLRSRLGRGEKLYIRAFLTALTGGCFFGEGTRGRYPAPEPRSLTLLPAHPQTCSTLKQLGQFAHGQDFDVLLKSVALPTRIHHELSLGF